MRDLKSLLEKRAKASLEMAKNGENAVCNGKKIGTTWFTENARNQALIMEALALLLEKNK